jgi:hypothetical protein
MDEATSDDDERLLARVATSPAPRSVPAPAPKSKAPALDNDDDALSYFQSIADED